MAADEELPLHLHAYLHTHAHGTQSWAASMHNFPSWSNAGDKAGSHNGGSMEGLAGTGGGARSSGRSSEVASAGTSGAGTGPGWESGSRRAMRTASAMAMVTEDAPSAADCLITANSGAGGISNPYIGAVGASGGAGVMSPSTIAARLGRRQSTNDSFATLDGVQALSAATSLQQGPAPSRTSFRSNVELMLQMIAQSGAVDLKRHNSGIARSVQSDGTALSQAPSLGGRSSARLSDSTEAGSSRRPSYIEHGRRASCLELQSQAPAQPQGTTRRLSYLETSQRRLSYERPQGAPRRPSHVEYSSRRSSLFADGERVGTAR